jgi:hypothetical protein
MFTRGVFSKTKRRSITDKVHYAWLVTRSSRILAAFCSCCCTFERYGHPCRQFYCLYYLDDENVDTPLNNCSPIPKLLTHSSNSVTKLTDRKIRWIIRKKMKENLSTNDIGLLQNVSESRIRHIWCHYRITKINHILGRVHHPQTNGKIERFYETFLIETEKSK